VSRPAAADHALLASLGDDLKFVFITSAGRAGAGRGELAVQATPSTDTKCERCWHWRSRRRRRPAHPTICGRCVSQPVRRRRSPGARLMARGTSLIRAGGTRAGSMLPWLGLALILLIADQFTKVLILGYYQWATRPTSPFFNIVRAHNTGAAFSFLAAASGWQRWLFTGIAVAATLFILWLLRTHSGQKLFCLRAGLHPGRRGRQRGRPPAAWLRGRLPAVPLGEPLVLPGLQRGRRGITVGAACLILDELLRVRSSRWPHRASCSRVQRPGGCRSTS
jgi:signal peptidase II